MTFDFIEAEERKINAEPVQGEQSIMIQSDMKEWHKLRHQSMDIDDDEEVLDQLMFWDRDYDLISLYAQSRGWLQEDFTGMEIY